MRLILAAATLLVAALPASAQRLDTRVREVKTTDKGVTWCIGNANRGLQIFHGTDRGPPSAKLFQPPVEPDPVLDVALGFQFAPTPGTRFGVGSSVYGVRVELPKTPLDLPIATGRLLADGIDINFHPQVSVNDANPRIIYLSSPDDEGAALGELVLRAHWIDLELLDAPGHVLRRYRFDGLRIADTAEVVSIIKFSCDGARAD